MRRALLLELVFRVIYQVTTLGLVFPVSVFPLIWGLIPPMKEAIQERFPKIFLGLNMHLRPLQELQILNSTMMLKPDHPESKFFGYTNLIGASGLGFFPNYQT